MTEETPTHQVFWVHSLEPVTAGNGAQFGIIAEDDDEATKKLVSLAAMLGISAESITFKPVDGWQGYGTNP